MTPEVSVVIVNFNAGPALATTLESFGRGLAGFRWEAIVIDNRSTDGSESAAEHSLPQIRLLRQTVNAGFAKGVNLGVALTSAPLVLVVNPDCRLEPGAVGRLREELERHPTCAVIGPKILNPDGTLQESARGDPTLLTGLFGRRSLLSRLFPSAPIVRRNLASNNLARSGESSYPVDWISGACMLARREAIDRVRGFDERYFLYWEDADFCRRLRGTGWHIRYMPEAVAIHDVGQSSGTARALASREFHRSAYRYYTTHVVPQRWHPGRPLAWAILAVRAAVTPLSRFSPPSRRSPGTP